MGTNFYLTKRAGPEELKEVHLALDNYVECKINEFEFLDKVNKLRTEIHIGKRSYGWQFLWDYHGGKYYKPNLESIYDWLEDYTSNGWDLVDEYGQVFTVQQFFNEELKGFLHEGYTHRTYYEAHPEEPQFYDPDKYEFISAGQRFSKSEDFA